MSGRYTKEMHEAYVKEQQEKATKEAQERRERTEKETATRAWVRDGGSAQAFEEQWPRMRDEGRRQRVFGADEQARQGMTDSGISRI
jgi:hypothetical protein